MDAIEIIVLLLVFAVITAMWMIVQITLGYHVLEMLKEKRVGQTPTKPRRTSDTGFVQR